MKKNIPIALIFCRVLFSLLIIVLAQYSFYSSPYIVIVLMYAGILSDIFDGIIARNLNISTASLRRADTLTDLAFYSALVYYISKYNPAPLVQNNPLIFIILFLEFLMYATCLARFRKLPSPHALLSKFWGLYLIVEFTLLLLGVNGSHFTIALITGIVVHTDRLLIYLLLPSWAHDIPSCWHAVLTRQGQVIKRHKLFNG